MARKGNFILGVLIGFAIQVVLGIFGVTALIAIL